MATSPLPPIAAGEPPVNFAAHQIRAGSLAGAREDFEQMLAALVRAMHPAARRIAAHRGDWGIDVLLGELSGMVVIWQAKYFWPVVTAGAHRQIRGSFRSALTAAQGHGYQVGRWVLCVPAGLDAPTAQWWDRWSAHQRAATGVAVELWDDTVLRGMLMRPAAAHVRRHYYDPYPHAPCRPVVPEQRTRSLLAAHPADLAAWNHQLFVRQLRAAGHVEVASAVDEYFNAGLLVREVRKHGRDTDREALDEAYGVAYGIWEGRFNAGVQAYPARSRLPGLHAAVMAEIRESLVFPPGLAAGPVHRCGLMHRLVQDGRAGWVRHWRRIAGKPAA
ncbi:serine/threonine protein kinase [Mangrovihabitans endophyticus]|uniref:Restriction endonuclease n=1 Tax=Mangrovihabitans endophyticus TaxID=1751298 RepID=A0A8J3C2A8_9ACTN|nr:serine/threonine protein kinase [Mangrovihabitans endophyticus]GGL00169.1 hypothetical protein GCM10012284_38230 [Mangrovihabitans endophyticus]